MSDVVIWRGGQVVSEEGVVAADVRVEDGRITAVGPELPTEGGEWVEDVTGKLLLPGLFDARAHLREPGREDQ